MYGMSAKDRMAMFENKSSSSKKGANQGPKKIGKLNIGNKKADDKPNKTDPPKTAKKVEKENKEPPKPTPNKVETKTERKIEDVEKDQSKLEKKQVSALKKDAEIHKQKEAKEIVKEKVEENKPAKPQGNKDVVKVDNEAAKTDKKEPSKIHEKQTNKIISTKQELESGKKEEKKEEKTTNNEQPKAKPADVEKKVATAKEPEQQQPKVAPQKQQEKSATQKEQEQVKLVKQSADSTPEPKKMLEKQPPAESSKKEQPKAEPKNVEHKQQITKKSEPSNVQEKQSTDTPKQTDQKGEPKKTQEKQLAEPSKKEAPISEPEKAHEKQIEKKNIVEDKDQKAKVLETEKQKEKSAKDTKAAPKPKETTIKKEESQKSAPKAEEKSKIVQAKEQTKTTMKEEPAKATEIQLEASKGKKNEKTEKEDAKAVPGVVSEPKKRKPAQYKPIPEEFYDTLFYFSGMGTVVGSALTEGVYVPQRATKTALGTEIIDEVEEEKEKERDKGTFMIRTARTQASNIAEELRKLQLLLGGLPNFGEQNAELHKIETKPFDSIMHARYHTIQSGQQNKPLATHRQEIHVIPQKPKAQWPPETAITPKSAPSVQTQPVSFSPKQKDVGVFKGMTDGPVEPLPPTTKLAPLKNQPKKGVRPYGVHTAEPQESSIPWQEKYGSKSVEDVRGPQPFHAEGEIPSGLKPWELSRLRGLEARGFQFAHFEPKSGADESDSFYHGAASVEVENLSKRSLAPYLVSGRSQSVDREQKLIEARHAPISAATFTREGLPYCDV